MDLLLVEHCCFSSGYAGGGLQFCPWVGGESLKPPVCGTYKEPNQIAFRSLGEKANVSAVEAIAIEISNP
jgi:hypothetical protein